MLAPSDDALLADDYQAQADADLDDLVYEGIRKFMSYKGGILKGALILSC